MIGRIAGTLLDSGPGAETLVDVHGVGFLLHCSTPTQARLGGAGSPVVLVVETVMREDQILLYGFADSAERAWFRLLTRIQGVGPRLALAVLSALPPPRLAAAVAAGDRRLLATADGVGPRLAQRIATELKDKLPEAASPRAAATGPGGAPAPAGTAAVPGGFGEDARADAVSALVNLGYGASDAAAAVARAADRPEAASLPELIRLALRDLAPREAPRESRREEAR